MNNFLENITCEILIVGSGPGGSISSLLLAQAGRDVLVVEEGASFAYEVPRSYTLEEQQYKYRNVGLTPALGKIKVPYIEARCVGGASEINAGLYHRPIPEVLVNWETDYRIENFGVQALEPYFEANERVIPVSTIPNGVGKSSRILEKGARLLHWKTAEVPRAWRYNTGSGADTQGVRQSMTQSLIPQAIAAGCRMMPQTKIQKIVVHKKNAKYVLGESVDDNGQRKNMRIDFKFLFVCAGAIQTPALLRRSGIKRNVGNSLAMHPAVRIIADFKEPVHDEHEGVPVMQVLEFKPVITLGASYSGLPHVALWLAGREGMREKLSSWKNLAIFYAIIMSTSRGTVRNVPFVNEAFVRLSPTQEDLKALGLGIYKLGELLFAAGVREIYPPMAGYPVFKSLKEMEILKDGIPADKADVSTLHLFSSCPMGNDLSKCAVDSYGKLYGVDNIYLNDASILPGPPGVNPQALIMAIARRNIDHFLGRNINQDTNTGVQNAQH